MDFKKRLLACLPSEQRVCEVIVLGAILGLVTTPVTYKAVAQGAAVIRGEISTGSYGSFKTDASGNMYITGGTSPVSTTTGGATWSGPVAINAGTSTLFLVAADSTRKYLMVQNNSALSSVYISTTSPVTALTGIRLKAGENYAPLVPPVNALFIVADSANTSPVQVLEAR